jgi:hypothetical protein
MKATIKAAITRITAFTLFKTAFPRWDITESLKHHRDVLVKSAKNLGNTELAQRFTQDDNLVVVSARVVSYILFIQLYYIDYFLIWSWTHESPTSERVLKGLLMARLKVSFNLLQVNPRLVSNRSFVISTIYTRQLRWVIRFMYTYYLSLFLTSVLFRTVNSIQRSLSSIPPLSLPWKNVSLWLVELYLTLTSMQPSFHQALKTVRRRMSLRFRSQCCVW